MSEVNDANKMEEVVAPSTVEVPSTMEEVVEAAGVVAQVFVNPLADPSFEGAYTILYEQISAIVQFNKVNYMNVALIFKAVIETIDALSETNTWDDVAYQNNCTNLITFILADLHEKGKISKTLYGQLSMGIPAMSYTLVSLIHLANRGEIALHAFVEDVKQGCIAKCAKKPVATHRSSKQGANRRLRFAQ